MRWVHRPVSLPSALAKPPICSPRKAASLMKPPMKCLAVQVPLSPVWMKAPVRWNACHMSTRKCSKAPPPALKRLKVASRPSSSSAATCWKISSPRLNNVQAMLSASAKALRRPLVINCVSRKRAHAILRPSWRNQAPKPFNRSPGIMMLSAPQVRLSAKRRPPPSPPLTKQRPLKWPRSLVQPMIASHVS